MFESCTRHNQNNICEEASGKPPLKFPVPGKISELCLWFLLRICPLNFKWVPDVKLRLLAMQGEAMVVPPHNSMPKEGPDLRNLCETRLYCTAPSEVRFIDIDLGVKQGGYCDLDSVKGFKGEERGALVHEGGALVHEGGALVHEGGALVHEGGALVHEGGALVHEGGALVHEGGALVHEGGALVHEGGALVHEGGALVHEGGALVHEGGALVHEGGALVHEGGALVHEGGALVHEGGALVHERG